jgi:hypothetical protein
MWAELRVFPAAPTYVCGWDLKVVENREPADKSAKPRTVGCVLKWCGGRPKRCPSVVVSASREAAKEISPLHTLCLQAQNTGACRGRKGSSGQMVKIHRLHWATPPVSSPPTQRDVLGSPIGTTGPICPEIETLKATFCETSANFRHKRRASVGFTDPAILPFRPSLCD